MVKVRLIEGPLPAFDEQPAGGDTGAEVIFHGIVRGEEGDRTIVALDYEAYGELAVNELERLGKQACEQFHIQDLFCDHRIGQTPVGEASLRVVIWSRHRGDGYQALAWFMRELKEWVPIWKWGVTADGERFPSTNYARQIL